MSGTFITFEGPEGAGKTTIIHMVQQKLIQEGYNIVLTREPGGIRIAEQIRSGSVNINEGFAAAYGSVAAPMGGMGQSGLGRRHGIEGLLRFTQPQTIARQRWVSIGPKFGRSEEQWTSLLSKSLLVLKKLRIR